MDEIDLKLLRLLQNRELRQAAGAAASGYPKE